MKRILTERAALPWLVAVGVGVATLVFATRASAEPAEAAERAAARAHFDRGVTLAKARDYVAALVEFQRAYDASPHFGVLYNIAQAKLALNRTAEAITTLQRYLDEAGDQIDPNRKAEVESLLVRLRSELDSGQQQPQRAADVSAAPSLPEATVGVTTQTPAGQPSSAAAPSTTRAATDFASPPPPPSLERRSSSAERTLAYVIGGAGLALSGAALGHYLWNRGRYQDWQEQYRAYHEDPTDRRRDSANRLSDSISRASVASVALAVGAGLALSTGAVLLLTSGPASSSYGGQARPFVHVQGRFE